MLSPDENGNGNARELRDGAASPDVIALQALAWILGEEGRANRLLSLTGLDAEQLRARATDPVLWQAAFDFLAAHEPDLIACARDLSLTPERLMRIAQEIAG